MQLLLFSFLDDATAKDTLQLHVVQKESCTVKGNRTVNYKSQGHFVIGGELCNFLFLLGTGAAHTRVLNDFNADCNKCTTTQFGPHH